MSVGGNEGAVRCSVIGVIMLLWTHAWKLAPTVPYLLLLSPLPGTFLLPLPSRHIIFLNRHALLAPMPLLTLFLLPRTLSPACHSARPAQMASLWACSLTCPQGFMSLTFGLSEHFIDSSKMSSTLLFHVLVCLPEQNVSSSKTIIVC